MADIKVETCYQILYFILKKNTMIQKMLQKWKLESVYQLFHFICEKWIPKDGEFIQGHIGK